MHKTTWDEEVHVEETVEIEHCVTYQVTKSGAPTEDLDWSVKKRSWSLKPEGEILWASSATCCF